MIKAILFDIDGVLLDSFEANLKFFQNLMIKSGYKPPTKKEFNPHFHLSMMDAIKVLSKSTSEEEIKRIWKMGASREVPYDVSLLKMPECIEDVIKSLSKQFSLGIVTSRQRKSVFEAPTLAKLKKYFKVVISYEDTLNHKPHPDPLILAAKKLGLKNSECVYVGDTENDLKAAKSAGMKIVVFSKVKLNEADVCTYSFKDLPSIIDKL
jgi:HAD superfamily hydrolase (TIGR01549 family)